MDNEGGNIINGLAQRESVWSQMGGTVHCQLVNMLWLHPATAAELHRLDMASKNNPYLCGIL